MSGDAGALVGFAVVGGDGRVLRCGETVRGLLALQAGAGETAHELPAGVQVAPRHWRRDSGGTFVLDPVADLAALKAKLAAAIDAQAEKARLRFITAGAGQALEYQATEAQARAWLAATTPDLPDYPFLQAEVLAQHDATGTMPDAGDVAAEVIAQADAWEAVGAEIKRLRRAAKIEIAAAATATAARAAAAVTWPAPG